MDSVALHSTNKVRHATETEYIPLIREESYILHCLSRIWNCIARALYHFVDWLFCCSAKKDKSEDSASPFSSSSSASSVIPTTSALESISSLSSIASSATTITHAIATQSTSAPKLQIDSNTTAEEFVKCVGEYPVMVEQAQEFLKRGGILNIATQEKQPITIRKDEPVIIGCTAGINRSQTAAAVLKPKGINFRGIFSGRMLCGDISNTTRSEISSLFKTPPDQVVIHKPKEFFEAFGMKKWDQIGRETIIAFPIDEADTFNEIEAAQKKRAKQIQDFYQKYIDELSPTHFITFAESGPEVLKCLLKRKGSLAGFIITYSPMADTIQGATSGERGIAAYKAFGEEILQRFNVESPP